MPVPGLAGMTIETARGMSLSLDRGPGGLTATRRDAKGRESSWVVLGASRGEAGILGEGIRQALLRDPTYRPRSGRRVLQMVASRMARDDPASRTTRPRSSGEMLAEVRLAAAATSRSPAASTPRAAYERAAASAPTGPARPSGGATIAACRPTTSVELPAGQGGAARPAARERARVHRIEGERGPDEARRGYEDELRDAVGERRAALDLILLGLGPDGHGASLFPGKPALDVRDGAAVGVPRAGLEPFVPRVTLTLPVLNAGREVVFMVTGRDKAEAVGARSAATPSPRRPAASCAPTSGELTVLLDAAAAMAAADRLMQRHSMNDRGGQPVPADRRLRVPVGLRDVPRWSRPSGNDRVDVPAAASDSPSVFGAMLDRDAGSFRLGPPT